MNPLFKLWILVLCSAVALSVIFYLAENYAHIIGNFYVLLGLLLGGYLLYGLFDWVTVRRGQGNPPGPP